MSYQVKRTLVSILTGLILLFSYWIYAFGKIQSGVLQSDNLHVWAGTILVFIGISIVAAIVIQIVFHIMLSVAIAVQEKIHNRQCDGEDIEKIIDIEMISDEMDKLIELKSMQAGFVTVGIGFVASLVSLLLNYSPVVMLNILFVAFSLGALLSEFMQLYLYRVGVKND